MVGRARRFWSIYLAVIIAAGLLSRLVHTGVVLFDKYLGDALYAAMVYAILRLLRPAAPVLWWSGIAMLAIELFQLTMIPAQLLTSEHVLIRVAARLLGTHFSVLDLLAYAVGIACIYGVDALTASRPERQSSPSPPAS